MTEHETLLARRRRAVFAGHDLPIGAADPQRQRTHENATVPGIRVGDIIELQ